jgi:hypothetical protein
MIYLYGLVDGDLGQLQGAVIGQAGLEGPVEVTKAGLWGPAWSVHGEAEVQPRRRAMLAHSRIQEALIAARASAIAAEFAKEAGAVELGLRIECDRKAALGATLAEDEGLRREGDRLQRLGREAHFAIVEFGGKLADRLDRRRGQAQSQLLKPSFPISATMSCANPRATRPSCTPKSSSWPRRRRLSFNVSRRQQNR